MQFWDRFERFEQRAIFEMAAGLLAEMACVMLPLNASCVDGFITSTLLLVAFTCTVRDTVQARFRHWQQRNGPCDERLD